MKTPIELIKEERERQISKKGWSREHDDGHTDGSIRVAAAQCACDGTDAEVVDPLDRDWGITDRHGYAGQEPDEMHILSIAGALIVAEMERLQRIQSNSEVSHEVRHERSCEH